MTVGARHGCIGLDDGGGMTQRAGRIWFSAAATPPPLVDGQFTDGWTLLGYPDDRDRHLTVQEWQRARDGKPGRALQFYVLAEPDVDVDALPGKAWLGVDPTGHDGTVRLVSAAPAHLGAPLRLREPEQHPGVRGPHRPVPVKTGTRSGVSFRRADRP